MAGEDRSRSQDYLFRQVIEQLRAFDWLPSFAQEGRTSSQLLAQHLEWRLEPRGDAFDLTPTGDAAADRAALVAWLRQAADAPPFLAPSWGRTFSESIAWLIQHDLPFTCEGMVVSAHAAFDPEVERSVHERGVNATYAAIDAAPRRVHRWRPRHPDL